MVPSLLCLPQMVTAPSCPSLLESWVLLWRSPPPWKFSPQTTVLRKKERNWPGHHLQETWIPHHIVVLEKRLRQSPLQGTRRAPRIQRPSLSPAGSQSTLWKAGGSPVPPKLELLGRKPQWAPALPPLPKHTLPLLLLITPPRPCHTSPPPLLPPPKATAKPLLLFLQPQRVQLHQKDQPQGKIKIKMWWSLFFLMLFVFLNLIVNFNQMSTFCPIIRRHFSVCSCLNMYFFASIHQHSGFEWKWLLWLKCRVSNWIHEDSHKCFCSWYIIIVLGVTGLFSIFIA